MPRRLSLSIALELRIQFCYPRTNFLSVRIDINGDVSIESLPWDDFDRHISTVESSRPHIGAHDTTFAYASRVDVGEKSLTHMVIQAPTETYARS